MGLLTAQAAEAKGQKLAPEGGYILGLDVKEVTESSAGGVGNYGVSVLEAVVNEFNGILSQEIKVRNMFTKNGMLHVNDMNEKDLQKLSQSSHLMFIEPNMEVSLDTKF